MSEDLSEHEFAYMPSNWSKRYGPMELLARFMNFSQNGTSKARTNIPCETDIPYGSSERTKYDIYGTDLPKDSPIFVFIHGGYWMEFSKDFAGFIAPVFVTNGIKVIVVGYDLCPSVKLTNIVDEIKQFTEKILKIASDSKSRGVWISGHSAGAHLAASLIYDQEFFQKLEKRGHASVLKGLLLISGIYKLDPLLRVSVNEALKLTSEEIRKYSFGMEEHSDKQISGLKVVVTVGEHDSPVFVTESKDLTKNLLNFVNNVEYLFLRNIDHFDIVENLTDPTFFLTQFILRHVKNNFP